MALDARVNFAYSTVSTAPSPATSGTSLVVAGGTWPAVPFNATIHAAGATEAQIASGAEIVRVTVNSSGTFTITRAQEGSAARTVVVGDIIKAGITKKTIDDIQAGGPFTKVAITPTAASLNQGLTVAQTGHGTWVSPGPWALNLNEAVVSSDDIDTVSQGVYSFYKRHNFGGTNATGQRIVDVNWLTQTAATNSANAVRYYMGSMDVVQTDEGDGGTNTGAGALGGYMVSNPILFSGAPNAFQLCGMEIDIYGTTDATQKYVMGLSLCSAHLNQGVSIDTAIDIHSLGEYDIGSPAGVAGPGVGFKYALALNELGNSLPPISSDGTVVGANLGALSVLPVANGIDFHNFSFSSYAFQSPGFFVNGTGKIGIGTTPANGLDMKSTSSFLPQIINWNDANNANSSYFILQKSRAGGPSQVSDTVGTILWRATDTASSGQTVAVLDCVTTAVGSGTVSGYLRIQAAQLRLQSGQTGYASLNFPSGVAPTSPNAGDVWGDGKLFYGSGASAQIGIIPTFQIATVASGAKTSLSNSSTSAQSIFASANDVFTAQATTAYRFRAHVMLNTGTTTHTTSFGLGGTATFTSIHYDSIATSSAADTLVTPQMRRVSTASAAALTATSTAATTDFIIEGVMRVNGAGTIIPQITFSAGPTGTCEVEADSYFELWPVGANTVASVGPWA